jgi:Protein of unknown function (DUF5672)
MAACVIVPVHRPEPTELERLSLEQLQRQLGGHDIALVAPQSLHLMPYHALLGDRAVERFPDRFFGNVRGYNQLAVSRGFFQRFGNYEHVLIHQADVFVFDDQLDYWCSQPFDNIGAPHWTDWGGTAGEMTGVGNGGFCLRRVEACLRAIRWTDRKYLRARLGRTAEDLYWGHQSSVRTAPVDTAVRFAFEMNLDRLADIYSQVMPFGCHAWWNLDRISRILGGEPDAPLATVAYGTPPGGDIAARDAYNTVLRDILERSGNVSPGSAQSRA